MAKSSYRPDGVYPAIVTPFTKEGEIDEEAFRNVIRYVFDDLGVTGIVPAGSTGEFSSLTWEQHLQVLRIAVEEASGPVLAGTGTSGTSRTIKLSKAAADIGADGVIVVSPFYMKPTNRGMYMHFAALAEAVDIPIVMYQIPVLTGSWIPRTVVEDLIVEYKNIVGLKDSSGDIKYQQELLERVKGPVDPDFRIMNGWDEIAFPAFCCGIDGTILASANFLGDYWVQIRDLVLEGKIEDARKKEMEIHKITRIITATGAAGTKAALNMIGVKVGKPALPLEIGGSISYELREELRFELEKIGKATRPTYEKLEPTPEKPLEERFEIIGIAGKQITDFKMLVGEALFGGGAEVAHIDLLIGLKDGPVGEAFAKVFSGLEKKEGIEGLLAVTQPNEKVRPETLIIPTVTVTDLRKAQMIYGPAQSAVARAVTESVKEGLIPEELVDKLCIITNIFVHPTAVARHRVYINNYKAAKQAIRRALEKYPTLDELMESAEMSRHPFRHEP
ncbi:formaldehyde-activating enzyme [Candidatus Borrarchaeum sp.]|uniref:formaldehyde-activating enzyme n=1 Tax=Candidatus Borrarchaeum sp. TaxID=2846742 RepID=UPI00257C6378|nr:formaldehyde-activating enzyme [Candidatus Borrarchaeum sp.]